MIEGIQKGSEKFNLMTLSGVDLDLDFFLFGYGNRNQSHIQVAGLMRNGDANQIFVVVKLG